MTKLKVGDKVNGHRIVHLGRDHRQPPPKPKPPDEMSYEQQYVARQLGLIGPVHELLARKSPWRL